MSVSNGLQSAVFETLIPSLEADGFRVFKQPTKTMLPAFLQKAPPEAIAVKADRKIAFEVVTASGSAKTKLESRQKMFSAHPDWELRVVYAPPHTPDLSMPSASAQAIQGVLDQLQRILLESGPVPALLTAWSAFEAAGRWIVPGHLQNAQPTARLIEVLATSGCITPSEAARIQSISLLRNKAAHGDFTISFDAAALDEFRSIIETVLALPPDVPEPQTMQA